MNIFCLDENPYTAATYHCDKHVVKMIVESAQLLSTAHRQLDGVSTTLQWINEPSPHNNPKSKTILVLPGETAYVEFVDESWTDDDNVLHTQFTGYPNLLNRLCYNSTHHNHPCAVWVRKSDSNYIWLVQLLQGLLLEYTHRYGKQHATARMLQFLGHPPKSIPHGELTPFAQAMPDMYKSDNAVLSYRQYYVDAKSHFARWTKTPAPGWFEPQFTPDPI